MDRRILIVDGYISELRKSGTPDIEAVDDENSEEDDPVPPEVRAVHCSEVAASLLK